MTVIDLELSRTLGPGRERTTEELKELAAEGARRFDDSEHPIDPGEVLAWAAETFGSRLGVACSMANTVVPEMTAQYRPGVDVLFLDTGYHFAETTGVRDALEQSGLVTIVDVSARATREEHEKVLGAEPFNTDPELCCRFRKVEPLAAALAGYEAWVTGLRRIDTANRADAGLVEWDAKNGMVKINPLAAWTLDEVHEWAAANGALVNPLVDDGYPSIGCEPCTRRVEAGEDARAGRWAGSSKVECGIHVI